MFNWIQDQIFKMVWLQQLVNHLIEWLGISLNSSLGSFLSFFIYDVIKIIILLCVLIFVVSYIQSFFPPEKTKRILSKFKGVWANIVGALLGTITPFCSCSSIPLFMGFTAAGVPIGVTFSFLISSPMVDLASLILLMSIFGWKIAAIYVSLGLVIAIIGGMIIERCHLEDQVADFILNSKNNSDVCVTKTVSERIDFAKNQVLTTLKKVFIYILVGVGIGACIHNFIPEHFITNLLGNNNLFSVPLATLVGVPIYADIFGTIPIAESLLAKGAGLGTILSFMMAVTTLSLPSIIMLSKAIKPKLMSVYMGIVIMGIMLVGYLFNVFMIV